MLEFGLVENALHSLSEAMSYYHEADESTNADKYKFCVLLSCHCAELLLKEILYRNHPSLVFENIDRVKNIDVDEDAQTVGYRLSIQRVKILCGVELKQYEQYLEELGRTRNRVQHYKCSIDGLFFKSLMSKAFSAIEYVFLDVLRLRFEDYSDVIDQLDVEFLHEDAVAYAKRKADIQKEFSCRTAVKFKIDYDEDREITPPCPNCGAVCLAQEAKIRCKMCGTEYANLNDLHENDSNCLITTHTLRELGRRKSIMRFPIYECIHCDYETVVYTPQDECWMCLNCGEKYSGMGYCDDCGEPIPSEAGITKIAMSDYDTNDYKYLCPHCAKAAADDESYIGYYID